MFLHPSVTSVSVTTTMQKHSATRELCFTTAYTVSRCKWQLVIGYDQILQGPVSSGSGPVGVYSIYSLGKQFGCTWSDILMSCQCSSYRYPFQTRYGFAFQNSGHFTLREPVSRLMYLMYMVLLLVIHPALLQIFERKYLCHSGVVAHQQIYDVVVTAV